MKKVVFLRNKLYRPSSYYRVYQYIEGINDKDLTLSEYESDIYYKLNKTNNQILRFINKMIFMLFYGYARRIFILIKLYISKDKSIILVQRVIFPKYIGGLGKLMIKSIINNAKEVYWEFDDNILESKEITNFEKKLLLEKSNKIIVGNKFLKECLPKEFHKKIDVVNTTDKMFLNYDFNKANIIRINEFKSKFNIVWLGTDSNLKFLENIIEDLDRIALMSEKIINLKVICNTKLKVKTKGINIINIMWERERSINELINCHLGVMPLEENNYTLGKCSFKAIQYMGAGIPIAISPVGMNKEIVEVEKNGIFIEDTEFFEEFMYKLISDLEYWIELSKNSRLVWEERFNSYIAEKNIKKLLKLNN
ncbi:glycosyltransferase [Clostridium perfringens]|nr:glycosyltransferase [Clostridium perfringens]MDM0769769.1 glycosyltransferase [Clostridium perfringens]